jgi:hypothetical protein
MHMSEETMKYLAGNGVGTAGVILHFTLEADE